MKNYITDITIKKVRHLEDFEINLGQKKKHLIFTGKNGSGKTSVLEELSDYLSNNYNQRDKIHASWSDDDCRMRIISTQEDSDFIYAYFGAKRRKKLMREPRGIQKINLSKYNTTKLNDDFLQFLLNQKVERSFAKDDNDQEKVDAIDKWFNNFENMMKQIFDDSIKLEFNRNKYLFTIHRDNREPFGFNTLSDGYAAIMDIITELLLKVETTQSKSFDCEGLVLIDEVETHLHVSLQKNIFPMLTSFFPNIQFIVTTHSPFVLSSLTNVVICDLENRLIVEDLSEASYSGLIRNYFGLSSEYSNVLVKKFSEFKILTKKDNLSDLEKDRLIELDIEFKNISPLLSSEIYAQYIALRKEFLI